MIKHTTFKRRVHSLLFGKSKLSRRFNKILFTINILVFSLFAVEAVYPGSSVITTIEISFGILFLLEYIARLWLSPKKIPFAFDLLNMADLIVIFSLFLTPFVGNLAILRVIRSIKILRTYRLTALLDKEYSFLERNKDIFIGILNFIVFVGIMTVIVHVSQVGVNDNIETYLDAVYFTVSALTTTGFGDVIAVGTTGKILSIIIMIFGITLFVKIAHSIFRHPKIHYTCPDCGLKTHDVDASHCKHCGHVIKNDIDLADA